MNPTLFDYIAQGVETLSTHKQALINASREALNPLDRLAFNERIEEVNFCLSLFKDFLAFHKVEPTGEVPLPPPLD